MMQIKTFRNKRDNEGFVNMESAINMWIKASNNEIEVLDIQLIVKENEIIGVIIYERED